MPTKSKRQPDTTDRQTRPKNATTHPGKAAMEALAVRRKKDDIEKDKKAKKKRQQARKDKKTNEQTTAMEIAEFENQMALDDVAQEANFSRRKSKNNPAGAKRKKSQTKAAATATDTENEFDTELELSDSDQHKLKKQRVFGEAQALRRTETYLQLEDEDFPMDDTTPKARGKKEVVKQYEIESEDSQIESDDLDAEFETPKALKQKKAISPSNTDSSDVEIVNADLDFVDEEQTSKNGSDVLGKEFDNDSDLHNSKNIDLSKLAKPLKRRKDKKAFRKKVIDLKQALVAGNRKMTSSATSSGQTTSKIPLSKEPVGKPCKGPVALTATGRTEMVLKSKPEALANKAAELSDRKGVDEQAIFDRKVSQSTSKSVSNPKSRTSATAGNGIGISQLTHAAKKTSSNLNLKAETASFSDEDDSAERAAILQSPVKGVKRLSSKSIVKVESEARKSHAKSTILDSQTLSGWTTSVVPIFIYWFFVELDAWPTANAIEQCAQQIWDWRFGDMYPLDFETSPPHVQLLNQKLCEIRNFLASSALVNVDVEFQLANNNNFELSQEDIQILRQEYAKELFTNKQFIFGKYIVDRDGIVHKSQPYQSALILRTFAGAFKYIKDIKPNETDAPLPLSSYPKTVLAITAAAVERALQLTINNDYNFAANKPIPKPDPRDPNRKPTKAMFTFSETTWEPRIAFYLEKGVLNLKPKDWERIMTAAAEYSVVLKPSSKSKGKQRMVITEEELQLQWESDPGSG